MDYSLEGGDDRFALGSKYYAAAELRSVFFSHLRNPINLINPRSDNKDKAPQLQGFIYWFIHSEIFFARADKKRASDGHRRPVLTSETTKRKRLKIAYCILL
jgi:hypothetical protein